MVKELILKLFNSDVINIKCSNCNHKFVTIRSKDRKVSCPNCGTLITY